jgi:hypothetical protein
MLFGIEFGLCVVAVLLALIAPQLGARWFEKLENLFGLLARRQRLAVIAVGLLALALRAAVLPVEPIPEPGIHDEFSYLLMADTFAHGRVANPTHPMWVHFETFHVIQKPTYVSKYFPAQGLFLAAGQVILGHPFWGVWISTALMCAAICWMLQGWLSPEWALLGGFLAVIRLGTFSYWANSYLGGAVAAIGGALVLGALPRIKQQQRVRDALWMGLGFAILATSRPYEGLSFSLPIGVALLVWMFGESGPTLRVSMRRIILPLALVTSVTAGAMLIYFARTTGSPFRTPYAVYIQAYDPVPILPWHTVRAFPSYNHASMKTLYMESVLEQYQSARTDPFLLALYKSMYFWSFFLGPVFTLPFVMLAVVLPYNLSYKDVTRETGFLLVVCSITVLALLPLIYFSPHYAAPVTSAIYAVVLLTMREVRWWEWRGKPSGLFIVRAIPTICSILLLLAAAAQSLHTSIPLHLWPSWCTHGHQISDRAQIESHLAEYSGKQLAIVRYEPSHDPDIEWVYNRADIDNSRVVWARDMGQTANEELLRYFKDRRVWLLEPDEKPVKLSPYRDADESSTERHTDEFPLAPSKPFLKR